MGGLFPAESEKPRLGGMPLTRRLTRQAELIAFEHIEPYVAGIRYARRPRSSGG